MCRLEHGRGGRLVAVEVDHLIGDQMLGGGEAFSISTPFLDDVLPGEFYYLSAVQAGVVEGNLVGKKLQQPIPLAVVEMPAHTYAQLDNLQAVARQLIVHGELLMRSQAGCAVPRPATACPAKGPVGSRRIAPAEPLSGHRAAGEQVFLDERQGFQCQLLLAASPV